MTLLASLGLTPVAAAAFAAAILFAALLRGFTGFGFALAAVPLASLAVPPHRVVAAVLVMQVGIGLRDCILELRNADWRTVGRLVAGSLFGTPVGLLALAALPPASVRLLLGVMVAVAVVALWHPRRAEAPPTGRLALGAGFASGVANGIAAMAGPPVILYFLAFQPNQATMRSSLLVLFPLTSALALPMVAASGLLGWSGVALGLAGLPLMALGSWAGARAFRRFGGRSYRPAAAAALLLAAVASIAKGLAQLLG